MKNQFSSPASMSVVYTIEHVSTVPLRHWHAFVLAVTETFWQLPVRLRPGNMYLPSLNRAADLFRLLMSWRSVAIQAAVSGRST